MLCIIPVRKRENIKVKLEVDEPVKKIAKDANVSAKTVYTYKKNIRDFGTLRPPKCPNQGRPRKITLEMQEVPIF